MTDVTRRKRSVSRREFLQAGATGLAGGLLCRHGSLLPTAWAGGAPVSNIYHSFNGTAAQNVGKVFEMAYAGIENFIGPNDIVVLRPNLQWPRNGYTNSRIGKALIDLILNRPGGFTGEIIVVENQHRGIPHTSDNSGWVTQNKLSNGPWNWFELIQHFVEHQEDYSNGMHTDPVTGQTNVTFQFLLKRQSFTLDDPHPILSTYGGMYFGGQLAFFDDDVEPFLTFKYDYPTRTCFYAFRNDLVYSNEIARVTPLNTEYVMNYPVFKSLHSGLYISLYKNHRFAWDPRTEAFTDIPVKFINMCTLNHHGRYAGVTSIVKGHFGMPYDAFHFVGWPDANPATFYYAGGAIGYWMHHIRKADLHMSCAERVGTIGRKEENAYQAKAVAIATDPVALDYYVGKNILFPAGGRFGLGGRDAELPMTNDPDLKGGYYHLTLEFCHDPLADHSIINGTLNENEMDVHRFAFDGPPGDFDADEDVDLMDYRRFQGCVNGPARPPAQSGCDVADLDHDLDVDLDDYRLLLDCFNGPNRPPTCSP